MHPGKLLIKDTSAGETDSIYVSNNSPQTFSIDLIIYWICLCGSGLRNILTLHLNHTLQSLLRALSPRVFLPDVLKGSLFQMQAVLR